MVAPARTIVEFHHIEWPFSTERGSSRPPRYFCEYDFGDFDRITDSVVIRGEHFGMVEEHVIYLVNKLCLIPGVLQVSVTPHSIELEINLDDICWGAFINRCHLTVSKFLTAKGWDPVTYKTTYLPEEKPCND